MSKLPTTSVTSVSSNLISQKSTISLNAYTGPPSTSAFSANVEQSLALISYCLSSIAMTVSNRYIFAHSKASMNFFLLLLQSLFSLLVLFLLHSSKLIKVNRLEWAKVRYWLHVVFLLVGMIFTASKGLQFLKVANFTVCKNVMIVFMAAIDYCFFAKRITEPMVYGLILIVGGSVLGGYSDMSFNGRGYAWLLANCICSGMYLIRMRTCIKKVAFTDVDTMFYNCLLSIPILTVLSAGMDNWKHALELYFSNDKTPENMQYAVGVFVSCIAGFCISFSTAWCLRVLSTTTYSVAGALNKLPVSISGLIFFKEERNFSAGNIASILFAFIGGCFYSAGQVAIQRKLSEEIVSERQSLIEHRENEA